jgi:hypothetical protein
MFYSDHSKLEKDLKEVYQRIYAFATPSCNFNKILDNPPSNAWYLEYEIEADLVDTIIMNYLQEVYIDLETAESKERFSAISKNILFGLSPDIKHYYNAPV